MEFRNWLMRHGNEHRFMKNPGNDKRTADRKASHVNQLVRITLGLPEGKGPIKKSELGKTRRVGSVRISRRRKRNRSSIIAIHTKSYVSGRYMSLHFERRSWYIWKKTTYLWIGRCFVFNPRPVTMRPETSSTSSRQKRIRSEKCLSIRKRDASNGNRHHRTYRPMAA